MLGKGFNFSFLSDAINESVVMMKVELTELVSIRKFVLSTHVIFDVNDFGGTKFAVDVSSDKLIAMTYLEGPCDILTDLKSRVLIEPITECYLNVFHVFGFL